MSIDKLKTKFFNGSFINDVKHYFSKINEIIDYLNNLVIPDAPTYKVYRALLSQTGTNAPTAIILENTLGFTPTWTRSSIGLYLSSNAEWAGYVDKVSCLATAHAYVDSFIIRCSYSTEDSKVYLTTETVVGGASDNLLSDGDLFTKSTIEIRVYN